MNALEQAQAALRAYSTAYEAIMACNGTEAELEPLYAGIQAWEAQVVALGGEV